MLRTKLTQLVNAASLQPHVHFLGLKGPAEVADWLRAADVFALSSAYEGMPMAALEALGSGLPVATTDVGEVRQVVRPGKNGAISADHSEEAFTACLGAVVAARSQLGGQPAVDAIQAFRPADVLAPVFENYLQQGLRHQLLVSRL